MMLSEEIIKILGWS